MKDFLELVSDSPQATQQIGAGLSLVLKAGDNVFLTGNLGAGKTCLVQGIAWGLGIDEYAQSPSFVLVRELCGRLPLYHVDLYRLDDLGEIVDLGLDDYFYGRGVTMVEWAEKGEAVLPPDHLRIKIEYISDTARRLSLMPCGERYRELIREFGRSYDSKGTADANRD